MAQFRPYEPELEKLSSPGSNSPLTPGPRGGTPLSFQTNVNRAKTRRWVEAKKVSYDGDDWGDDEYDEYDVKEQEPAPPSMHLNPRTNTSPAIMDRSRSMDNVATLGPDGWKGARSISADGTTAAELPMANKSPQGSPGSQGSSRVPIVRPANIYQRMRDERAERRQSRTDTSMPGPPNEYFPIVGRSSTDPVSQNLPGDETAAAAGSDHHELHMSREPVAKADNEGSQGSSTSTATQNTPVIKLPEVDRVSGFGTDFLSSSPDNQTSQSPESQKPPLQHNPSLGFRSAVHQAFDVPETPSSAVDSVVRSNSDSTSGVSPIIANRGFNDEKTPTITEEPEAATPPTSERNSIVFKPGHRRDLSLPSPGNSPSRKPIVTSEQTPPSALAQVSSVDPSDIHSSEQIPPNMPTKDIPPLRVSSPVVSGNASSELPVLIPSMSTDNSPQDTESDRLRKEIIRSLSRENTPSDEPEPEGSRPQTRREDSLIPSEYERYWNEEASLSPNDQPRPSIPEYNPQPPSRGLYSSDSHVSSPLATGQDSRPKLKKRFSWESSTSSSDEPTPAAGLDLSQSTTSLGPSPLPDNSTSQLGTETETGDVPKAPTGAEQGEAEKPEKPKLTIIPPSTGDNNSIISGQHLPEVYNGQPVRGPEGGNSPSNIQKAPSPVRALPGPPGETLLGFRDILGIKSSDERVKAFNRTRDQFGKIDTGLNNWIQVTVHDHPEHMDLVEKSQKGGAGGPRLAVTKSKFPKLPSLGNFGTSHQEGSPTGHGHVRRSSAPLGAMMHKQQVEQRGKDLLHTAGVLGGKAGEAAKGFFARGRSKLKAGGNDKDSESMHSRHKSFQLQQLPSIFPIKETRGQSSERPSGYFGSLPVMKNSRNVDTPTRFSLDSKRKMPTAPEHLAPGHRGSIRNSKATSADDVTQWRAIDRKGKAVDKTHRQPSLLDLEREIVKALRLDEEDPGELRKPASCMSLRPTSALEGPGNPEKASRLSIDNAQSTISITDASSHKSDGFVATQNDETAHVEQQNSRLTHSTLRALESGTNSKSVSGGQRQILEHQHLDFPGLADQADSSSTALCGATGLKTTNPIRLTLNDGAPLMTPVEEASEQSPGSIHGACDLTNASKCGDCRAEQAPSIRSQRSHGTTTGEQFNDAPVISTKSSHSEMRPFNESTQSSARDANLPKARDFQTDNIAGSSYAPLGEQSHHRQGSGAPLQLHQMPSVSSLGAQDGSIGRQYYQNLNLAWGLGERNYSVVSLPSDYNSEGHYRSLSDPPRSMDGALAPGHGGASVSEPGSVHGRQSPLLRNEAGNSTGTRSSFHDILSQPNSDSLDSTKVNPATSGHDLSDAAAWGPFEQGYSAHKRASAMRKLKMVGKLPQLSRAVPHRRAFSRFSGLFGRTNNAQIPPSNPPQPRVFDLQHQHQQHSASALTLQIDRPRSRENRSSEHLPSFRGLPPPPQGYYAPESYDAFIGGHKLTGQRQKIITENTPNNNTNININTNTTQTDTMSSRLYSYQPTPSQPIIPYRYSASSLPHTPPSRRESETSRGRSSGRTYAQDLHLRSRSPKNFPPSPEEKTMSSTDLSDPAYHLGIFRSNPRTSRLGDQELPWKITIPGESEERAAATSSRYGGGDYQYGLDMSRPHRGSAPAMPMPLVTEDVVGSSNHPHRGQGRAINSVRSPIELPADDSSEEIVMSSTAYPGQEWRPLGLSGWQY